MGYVVAFLLGICVGSAAVIMWALAAAQKNREDE